jgi:hypothetical protein
MVTIVRTVGVLVVLLAVTACAAPSRTAGIEIQTREAAYELTVPVSRLTMTIPKGGLLPATPSGAGSVDNPRYFYLEDTALRLIVSGWFEPEQRYPGIEQLWSHDTANWRRRQLPEPENVVFSTVDKWDVVMYDMPFRVGAHSHMRAQWVQAGTWIDVHLSIVSRRSSRENRATLHSLLGTIRINQKS